jgi:hypothetical protein
LGWALEALVVAHLSVARIAEGLAVSWNTANSALLAEGRRLLLDDPQRLAGVSVIGVDEHVWRQTRRGDTYALRDHVSYGDQGDVLCGDPFPRRGSHGGTPMDLQRLTDLVADPHERVEVAHRVLRQQAVSTPRLALLCTRCVPGPTSS